MTPSAGRGRASAPLRLAVVCALALAAACAEQTPPPADPAAVHPPRTGPVPTESEPIEPDPDRGEGTTTVPTDPVPAPLVDPVLDLRAGPVAVPIALHLPSLGVEADVLGVGLTAADAMDAPVGGPGDPVWQQAFWYRGSAVPGAASTALLAGHVGSRSGPGVFARLGELAPGDPIVVEDRRTGGSTRFVVTETAEYTLEEAASGDVMDRIYGAGPVAGTGPAPSADGLAHLTLVTCSGTFRDGTHDHRRVVSAVARP